MSVRLMIDIEKFMGGGNAMTPKTEKSEGLR
jgi:hypothetical protein